MRQSIGSLTFAVASISFLVLSALPVRAASATFDSDLEGWQAVGIDFDVTLAFPPRLNSITLVENVGDMVHEGGGGNPGGYARLTDAIRTPSSFAAAPESFLAGGDLSSFTNLSFDHRLFDTGMPNAGIAPYSALLISGDPTDLNVLVWSAPAPAGPTDWVHFEIPINEANLVPLEDVSLDTIDPSLPSLTLGSFGFTGTMTFEEILGSVDELLVAFELVDNEGVQMQEHGGVDNIELVPEPASAALLLLVTVTGLGRRRRGSG